MVCIQGQIFVADFSNSHGNRLSVRLIHLELHAFLRLYIIGHLVFRNRNHQILTRFTVCFTAWDIHFGRIANTHADNSFFKTGNELTLS